MKLIFAVIILFGGALPSIAQSVSTERQTAMLPWIVRDREQAMNDKALCSADLAAMGAKLFESQKQLADAKAELEKLKPTP